jgi:hypothetical protein
MAQAQLSLKRTKSSAAPPNLPETLPEHDSQRTECDDDDVPTPKRTKSFTVTPLGQGPHNASLIELKAPDVDINIGFYKEGGKWKKSKWMNPFQAADVGSKELSLQLYRNYILTHHKRALHELYGKRMGLYLRDGEANHGEVLLELLAEAYPV